MFDTIKNNNILKKELQKNNFDINTLRLYELDKNKSYYELSFFNEYDVFLIIIRKEDYIKNLEEKILNENYFITKKDVYKIDNYIIS